jgi:hypothetical protein
MDYSLLVGIHDMIKGNKEKIRDNTLALFEPDLKTMRRPSVNRKKHRSFIKNLSNGDSMSFGPSSTKLTDILPEE